MISFCLREINPEFINQQNMSRGIKGKLLAVKVKQVLSKFKGNVWQDLQMNYNYCFAVVCLCAVCIHACADSYAVNFISVICTLKILLY